MAGRTNKPLVKPRQISREHIVALRPARHRDIKGKIEYREELRATLPVLDVNEIRRHRIPFHEAMCSEIEEEGFHESSDYIRRLIQLDHDTRQKAGPETLLWKRPQLRKHTLNLQKLRFGLTEAETAKKKGNKGSEAHEFLRLAVFFMLKNQDWWWVAEQLFLLCVEAVTGFRTDGGRKEATTRYIYGLFLFQKLGDVERAKTHLQIARELSAGKSWRATKELGQPQDTIYIESNSILYKALIELGVRARKTDPLIAVKLCTQAHRRALECDRPKNVADALLELAVSYQSTQEYDMAIMTLKQLRDMCSDNNLSQGLCKAHLELAFSYKSANIRDVFPTIRPFMFSNCGTKHLEAIRLHNTKGATHKAIPALVTSLFKMHQHGTPEQLEQTRAIAAAAAGTDVMPPIGKLILSKDPESLKTLVAWKESQKPFWKEGSYYFAPSSMADKSVGPTADEYAQSYSGLMRVPFVGKDLELLKRLMGDEDDQIPFPKQISEERQLHVSAPRRKQKSDQKISNTFEIGSAT
uniref:Tetratricopeptide repeat protein 29 n=1 Tax=Timema bartmani TaxID=61472 RepID=A0A7R9ERA2_9NEOP|nr:unnamed protein product [Timema bartmani]